MKRPVDKAGGAGGPSVRPMQNDIRTATLKSAPSRPRKGEKNKQASKQASTPQMNAANAQEESGNLERAI